ncbi:sulfurtransferase [Belliella marina]|uniref:Sulfurtransferase n=1 Tax=Belliella marina TaxID=1644146 RepID=A0ABW4VFV2_9BACT
MKISPIIETAELLKLYKNDGVLICDVSNHKHAKTNYEREHLEGAIFVDLNSQLSDIKDDLANGGRHPLPEIEAFAKTLTNLGISNDSHVVVYDDKSASNAAARFWWMLKSVGHQNVQVLNGGFIEAKKRNFPLGSKVEMPVRSSESYRVDKWTLPMAEIKDVENASFDKRYTIVDVREKDRYDGKIEPIDLIAGHIPGAINIPYTENLDGEGLYLKPNELREKYKKEFGGTNPGSIIVHCGSGVTACHTLLAMAYADLEVPKLYIGSWSEWSRNNKQIERTKT